MSRPDAVPTARRGPRSLRSRLLLLVLASVVGTALAGGLVVDRLVESRVVADFDEALVGKAMALATLTRQRDGELELDFADEFMPEFEDAHDPQYFVLRKQGGDVVERSRSLTPGRLARGAALRWHARPSSEPRVADATLPDGRPGRLVQVDFVPQLAEPPELDVDDEDAAEREEDPEDGSLDVRGGAPPGRVLASLVVARERETLDSRLLSVRLAMAGTGAALAGAVAALSAVALGVGLRPVHRLAREVQALDARSLATRLDESLAPAELRPVVVQVNALLERIRGAVERERQLTSDMAHDLKTPVAELRALCDVAVRWPEGPDVSARFFQDAREVSLTLQRTIERLLTLARHDAGRAELALSTFDVAELAESTIAAFRADATTRGLSWDVSLSGRAPVESDRDAVGQVLGNLVENAVDHAVPGTVVTCRLEPAAGGALALTISNQAAGLEREDLPHVFERFWRKDTARTDRSHAGLGLAMAKASADLLGLGLDVGLDASGRFVASLVLPRAVRRDARAV